MFYGLSAAKPGDKVRVSRSDGKVAEFTVDDVQEGVADMISMVQVEATFPDGTKLVTVHDPIR